MIVNAGLRNRHSGDASFALQPFAKEIAIYAAEDGELVEQSSCGYPPISAFTDARPNRYQNPKLPFDGANIPDAGLSFKLGEPAPEAQMKPE
jgi:hypothetical protein